MVERRWWDPRGKLVYLFRKMIYHGNFSPFRESSVTNLPLAPQSSKGIKDMCIFSKAIKDMHTVQEKSNETLNALRGLNWTDEKVIWVMSIKNRARLSLVRSALK